MTNVRVTGRTSLEDARCAICHDVFGGASAATCDRCASAFHEDCRNSLGRCPTLGCAEPAPPVPRPAEAPDFARQVNANVRAAMGVGLTLAIIALAVITFTSKPPPGRASSRSSHRHVRLEWRSREAQPLANQAVALFDAAKYPAARKAALSALATERAPRAHAILAALRLVESDEPLSAAAELEEALAVDPDDAWIRAMLGVARLHLGDPERALLELDRACWSNSTSPRAWAFRAAALLRRMDATRAMLDATRALALDARDGWVWAIRGEAWHHLGNDVQAILDLDRALELDPDLTRALRVRSDVHAARGDDERAQRDLDRATRAFSRDPLARALLDGHH